MSFFKIVFIVLFTITFTSKIGAQEVIKKTSTSTLNLNSVKKSKTKALIIGISEYANVRSLNYANSDANEFVEFLMGNDGWNIPEENILLLTNDQAKQGDILMGLQWLLDASESGEEVIFYFSGHGDVEKIGEQKKGFLLAHDAPKNNYPLGGTIEVQLLDSVFSELINKDVKVTMIIDACRSGNLAGGMSGKSQTTEALAKRWKNETRILSAQPEQLSYEDTIWGGGRGVFSYYLVKGLSGHADANGDLKVFLSELEQYIGNNISIQTDYTQQPVVDGPNKYSMVVSLADSLQMGEYANDRVEGEINLTLASTKSGEENIDPACAYYANGLMEMLNKGLKIDSFATVEKLWADLENCSSEDFPLQVRYKYMRSLINEINRVLQNSLTGQKLVSYTELLYAGQLLNELLEINKGRKFVGEEHFKNLVVYINTLQLTDKENCPDFWNVLDYTIVCDVPFEDYDSEYDLSRMNSVFNENNTEVVKIIAIDTSATQTIITFQTNLKGALTSADAFKNYYSFEGKMKENVLIKGDTLLVGEIDSLSMDFVPLINEKNFQHSYYEKLKIGIDKACLLEPDAAYLFFSKALLFRRLEQIDSSVSSLKLAIEKSPKWLQPRYALGSFLYVDKRYDEAIVYFEDILNLDSIYRNFECVDCFYMGLINMYLLTDKVDRIDATIEHWQVNSPKNRTTREMYWSLFSYSYDRDEIKFAEKWYEKMKAYPSFDFEDCFESLIIELKLNPNKYKKKKVLEFIHDFMFLEKEGMLPEFFSDSSDLRSSLFKNKLIQEFFPNNHVITGYERSVFFIYLYNSIYASIQSQSKMTYPDFVEEMLLSGVSRMETPADYLLWLENMDYLIKGMDYSRANSKYDVYTWRDWIEQNLTDSDQEFFMSNFHIDEKMFDKYYSSYFDDSFYATVLSILYNQDYFESEEYRLIKSKCVTFEDLEYLKLIDKIASSYISIE